jgi:hypothetical protein
MSSMTELIVDETAGEHQALGLNEFTRLEKMLLFAVVSECSRCIKGEGHDCFDFHKSMGCPFVTVREEYKVIDIIEWRERVR